MRIAIDGSFFSDRYEGGKEQVFLNLLKGWEELGLSQNILVICNSSAAAKFKKISSQIKCIVVKPLDYKIKSKGILFRTFWLPGLIKKYKADLLVFPVACTGFSRFNIPSVVMPHDIQLKVNPIQYGGYKKNLYDFYYLTDFKKRDHIVAISEFDKSQMEKYYSAFSHKITKIFNPIDFAYDGPCKNDSLEQPYIFANNMSYAHKNLKTLLKAFDLIKGSLPHNLVISGNLFIEDEETRELLKRLVKEHRLELKGFLAQDLFYDILANADVLVNPSFFEGFGMSAVEAMMAGVPCVLADTSAVREVTMNRCTYYQPADDPIKLAEAMGNVIGQKKDNDYLEMSRKMMVDRYHYLQISRQYYDFFENIIRDCKGEKV